MDNKGVNNDRVWWQVDLEDIYEISAVLIDRKFPTNLITILNECVMLPINNYDVC